MNNGCNKIDNLIIYVYILVFFAWMCVVKALLDEKPNDKNIQGVVDRLGRKLETAYGKEKKAEVSVWIIFIFIVKSLILFYSVSFENAFNGLNLSLFFFF